jgi:hypothetical protein
VEDVGADVPPVLLIMAFCSLSALPCWLGLALLAFCTWRYIVKRIRLVLSCDFCPVTGALLLYFDLIILVGEEGSCNSFHIFNILRVIMMRERVGKNDISNEVSIAEEMIIGRDHLLLTFLLEFGKLI